MTQPLYIPIQPLQQNATSAGTGTPAVISGYGVVSVEISGSFVANIVIEGQTPQGNWYPLNVYQVGAGVYTQNITGPGLYEANVRGLNAIRANITSYTSGTINAYATAQALSNGHGFISLAGSSAYDSDNGTPVTSNTTPATIVPTIPSFRYISVFNTGSNTLQIKVNNGKWISIPAGGSFEAYLSGTSITHQTTTSTTTFNWFVM